MNTAAASRRVRSLRVLAVLLVLAATVVTGIVVQQMLPGASAAMRPGFFGTGVTTPRRQWRTCRRIC
jgi:hypothetical protein